METPNATFPTPKKGFDFHKVFAAIGVMLVIAIPIVAGVWYFSEGRFAGDTTNDDNTVKTATNSAKKATSSAKKDETADWKTYENKDAGYKIRYPITWTFTNSPAGTTFEHARDILKGTEGEIDIDYGTGLGGGCGPPQEGQLSIKNSTLSVCIVNPDGDGGKTYNILGAISGVKTVSWRGFIIVNKPIENNEAKVLKVVGTLETTK